MKFLCLHVLTARGTTENVQLTHLAHKHVRCVLLIQLVGPETAVSCFGWTCAIMFETNQSLSVSAPEIKSPMMMVVPKRALFEEAVRMMAVEKALQTSPRKCTA